MKKWIALLLAAVLCLSLAACGNDASSAGGAQAQNTSPVPTAALSAPASEQTEPTEPQQEAVALSIGDKIDNDNFTMTFDSMQILDAYSYKTSEYSSTSLYVESGYKLLLVMGHIENKSMVTISDSSFVRTAVVNDSYTVTDYDVRLSFKRDKYFEIDPYTDLDYFLYINIPEKLAAQFEKAEFTLGFNNDMSIPVTEWKMDGTKVTPTDNLFSISGPGSAPSAEGVPEQAALEAAVGLAPSGSNPSDSKVKTIVCGDVIDTDDFTFTLNNVELTYELKPQNTSSVYTSYSAGSGKVYVHVDGQYYNKAKRDICIRDLFVPTADYDNGYTYKGFAVTDKDDNSFTWASSYVVCTPLETCHYHGLIECPKVVDETEAPLIVYLEIGGDTYQYVVR
ncbi:MAG: hypothetical protein PUD38_01475 [Firmicutes bacterium]|nr:hypothetical protein [Bacillota bacterium]